MGPLADLRVLDLSAVLAGPGCARYLADFGADVIKVERPGRPDTARNLGWRDPADGETFFFKGANRNKRFVELDLRDDDDRDRLLELVATSRVLVENLRPGKLDALGLTAERFWSVRPDLVITRVTAFGQSGPYRDRPGFATLAEAMSGFASINGDADGPPTLPPIALTDEVTALAAAFATLVAVQSGVGQEVDANLLESMLQMMGPLPSLFAETGLLQPRLGSGLPYSVPRGCYRTSDDSWIAVSTSADSVAARVMELIGLGDDPRVGTVADRMAHRDLVETAMADWVGRRTLAEALEGFERADAAAAPVYDVGQLLADPHVVARRSMVEADGYRLPGVVARLSATPGTVRHPGRAPGVDQAGVMGALEGEPVRLVAGPASLVVDPDGGRITSLRVDDHELLAPIPADDPFGGGSFPMVPWAGRVRHGRFAFDGDEYRLPLELPPHAGHGTTRRQQWRWTGPTELTVDLSDPWPFGGTAVQRFDLRADRLRLELEVIGGDRPMPVMVGWHPWYARTVAGAEAELEFEAAEVWELDDTLIPTGRRVPVPPGPWDHCFEGIDEPITIRWGDHVSLSLTSTCRPWVIYTEPTDRFCVEPQSQPPDAFNRRPATVEPGQRLSHVFELRWA